MGVFITLAGVSLSLALLFLAMRSVMEIGGACAEGGPFVPVRPCPKGVPLVMMGSIWGGLIFVGLYVWQSVKAGAPSLVLLAWPALFLSLGWNFLEFGLDPDGLVWGWLVSGGLFVLMGGGPLLLFGKTIVRKFRGPPVTSSIRGALNGAPPSYWLVLQLTAISAGIYAGVRFFALVTG